MFYRPGGTAGRINAQYDYVYVDFIGGCTAWLPVSNGNTISINVARASIVFMTAAQSTVIKAAVSPEVVALLEMKMFGGEQDSEAWPIDQWTNLVVATSRRAHRDGWVRLRVVNINNGDVTGAALALQISRTGDSGAVT